MVLFHWESYRKVPLKIERKKKPGKQGENVKAFA
jgi:hypothetical protein